MSTESVRARLEAATPAVETREWLRRRIRQDGADLELALDVIEAAKKWRDLWCRPLSGPALSAFRDAADASVRELKAAIDRWEAGT